MAGRKPNPITRYRVYMHIDKKYKYGAVQEPVVENDGRKKYKVVHLGKVDDNNVFHPNFRFKLLPLSEREKYIFPEEWNLSQVIAINQQERRQDLSAAADKQTQVPEREQDGGDSSITNPLGPQSGCSAEEETPPAAGEAAPLHATKGMTEPRPSDTILDQFNNKLYGSFWILEQISMNCALYEDLNEVFEDNALTVHSILSLAFYPYLSGKTYNRFARWQSTHKTMLEDTLNSTAITRLTQSITDHHRMSLISRRIKRQPEGALWDCDSTTRSGWGNCIACFLSAE